MRESVLLVVGAVVAVVLQIVLAPNLVILGAMPDLVLVYVGIAAMLLRRDSVLVMAFFAGLAMDLVGTSTVGVCAGLYTGFYILSVDVSVIEALGQRALPCALYDCAMALIVLPITTHMFAAAAPSHKAPTSSTVRLR